ncbi:DeoR family transcriptional regulator [Actinomadura keratinilytica]
MSLRELARVVQTSEVTVRRDVRALEAEGLLDRRHGGAVLPGGFTRESGFPQKSHLASAEKTAIADLAAGLVGEGKPWSSAPVRPPRSWPAALPGSPG